MTLNLYLQLDQKQRNRKKNEVCHKTYCKVASVTANEPKLLWSSQTWVDNLQMIHMILNQAELDQKVRTYI